jgi:hypothetical protein
VLKQLIKADSGIVEGYLHSFGMARIAVDTCL